MEIVMGAETEYALSVEGGPGVGAGDIADLLYNFAEKKLVSLPSEEGTRRFLECGGAIYKDYGDHIEYCSPETATPWDLVKYVRAGDHIIGDLTVKLSKKLGAQITVSRGNVGYGRSPETWACHESYSSRKSPGSMTDGLIPFLISRILFCGSGGFNPFSSGISFLLSPRTAFIWESSSEDSTRRRGIVHTKDERLNLAGYYRLHLLCGDALGSESAMWLRAGTTALVVCLLNHGYEAPRSVCPADPVRAMKVFASDQTLSSIVPTISGVSISALDIQWHYLRSIEEFPKKNAFPAWAPKVLEGWRGILELLQQRSRRLEMALDWTVKRNLYSDVAASHGIAWKQLPTLTEFMDRVTDAYRKAKVELPGRLAWSDVFGDQSPAVRGRSLAKLLQKDSLDWDHVLAFQELRPRLFELETRYLQLNGGVFEQLERAGVLEHDAIPDRNSICEAVTKPPQDTRARVRGEYVSQYAGVAGVSCGWSRVVDSANGRRMVDLGDPFTTSAEWQSIAVQSELTESGLGGMSARLSLREEAFTMFCDGRFASARRALRRLVRLDFELPSTHCHLARIELASDNVALAYEHATTAWAVCDADTPDYVTPRILWLRLAATILQGFEDQASLLGKLKTAFNQIEPYGWTLAPVLERLRPKLSDENYALLAAIARVIASGGREDLERFSAWRSVRAEPLD